MGGSSRKFVFQETAQAPGGAESRMRIAGPLNVLPSFYDRFHISLAERQRRWAQAITGSDRAHRDRHGLGRVLAGGIRAPDVIVYTRPLPVPDRSARRSIVSWEVQVFLCADLFSEQSQPPPPMRD